MKNVPSSFLGIIFFLCNVFPRCPVYSCGRYVSDLVDIVVPICGISLCLDPLLLGISSSSIKGGPP